MKRVKCSDATGESCGFVAEGKDGLHAKEELVEHVMEEHREQMEGMDPAERKQWVKKVDELVSE